MVGDHRHVALHDLTARESQIYRLVRVQPDPVPDGRETAHDDEMNLVVLEGECAQREEQDCGGCDPRIEGQFDARPGHQNLMVEELRSACEIARVPLNFSACGIVRQRGSILAEADVFTHGALARCAWLRE